MQQQTFVNRAPPARFDALPQHGVQSDSWCEQAIPQAPSTSHLQLYIRAENLRPQYIAKGQVALVNDLHLLPPGDEEQRQAKRVVKWSLHLRHRERAAIAIRVGSNMEPPPLDPSDVRSWSSTVQEEYKNSVRDANNWMCREDHFQVFDSELSLPFDGIMNKDGRESQECRFKVLVPRVEFPTSRSDQYDWSKRYQDHFDNGGTASSSSTTFVKPPTLFCSDNIRHNVESEMSYYARVQLRDGSIVEVPGGRSQFIPAPVKSIISTEVQQQPTQVLLASSDATSLSSNDDDTGQYQLEALLHHLPMQGFVKGRSYLIQGHLLESLDMSRLVPQSVSLRFIPIIKNKWTPEMVNIYRPDLLQELSMKKERFATAGSAFSLDSYPSALPSASMLVEQEVMLMRLPNTTARINQENKSRRGGDAQVAISGTFGEDLRSFSVHLTVGDDLLTSACGVFEDVEMRLEVCLVVVPRDSMDSHHYIEPRKLTAFLPIKIVGCSSLDDQVVTEKDSTLQMGSQRYNHNSKQRSSRNIIHHYLDAAAGSPVLVLSADDDDDDLQDLISILQDEESHFPLIKTTTKTQTQVQKAGQDEPSVEFTPLRFLTPASWGTADQEVGAVWAEQVLLPQRLREQQYEDAAIASQSSEWKTFVQRRKELYRTLNESLYFTPHD